MRVHWSLFARFAVLIAGLILVPRASAQFTVASVSPAHGSTAVTSPVTLEVVFSAALDTTFRFNDDFFLAAEVKPDTGEPQSLEVDPTLTTLTVVFDLEPDTQYWLSITGARSQSGDMLAEPAITSFTTASSLPAGSVSGTAFEGTVPAAGALVEIALVDSLFSDSDESALYGGYAVVAANGSFIANYVPAGDYVGISILDGDHDNQEGPGDSWGILDLDLDRFADVFSVATGEAVVGKAFAMAPYARATARALHSEITAEAVVQLGTAEEVFVVGSEVAPDGTAFGWIHIFKDPASDAMTTLFVLGDWIIRGGPDLSEFASETSIPAGWIDSNIALNVSESEGGADFRLENTRVEISAFLAGAAFLPFVEADRQSGESVAFASSSSRWMPRVQAPTQAFAAKSTDATEIGAAWTVMYDSDEEFNFFVVDALTGELLANPGRPSLASSGVDESAIEAASWASSATLVGVSSSGPDGIKANGESAFWSYLYYDPVSTTALNVSFSGGLVIWTEDWDIADLPSTGALPGSWIDSDAAMAVASPAAADFLSMHPDATTGAYLSLGLRPWAPQRVVWRIEYYSSQDDVGLEIYVDALSGAVITAVEPESSVPQSVKLGAPRPNPGRTFVDLPIEVQPGTRATLSIFDLLGRRHASQTVETGTTRIDVSTLPAGLYFVRVAGEMVVKTEPLVVIK